MSFQPCFLAVKSHQFIHPIALTVQPKAITFPTDAKLLARARVVLVRHAKRHGLSLHQSYERVGKIALIRYRRYVHAKQFKRANRALKTLRK